MNDIVDRAARALALGRLVVIPTDTVYGIGARPDLPAAIDAVFALKGRPRDRGLPVLGATAESLTLVADFDERALRLAEAFWPGPLTLVLPRRQGFGADLGGPEDGTVAVRIPAAEITLALLRSTGPLAVTSANKSGAGPAHTIGEARSALGDEVDVYVDGGVTGGTPSTVASLTNDLRVLREGPVDEAALREKLRP